jgi:hypothetical protein
MNAKPRIQGHITSGPRNLQPLLWSVHRPNAIFFTKFPELSTRLRPFCEIDFTSAGSLARVAFRDTRMSPRVTIESIKF